MHVFKSALRVVAARPVYLVVYVVFLGCMGLFVTGGLNFASEEGGYEPVRATFAVIDRDGSAVSQGLTDFLAESGEAVKVADEPFALQDAVATGNVCCLVIVPEGFGEAYLAAVRAGEEPPAVQTVFSFESRAGMTVDTQVDQYLGLVQAAAALEADASADEVVSQAIDAAAQRADVQTLSAVGGEASGERFAFYLQWSAYTITASIVVCIGCMLGAFNRTDVRRRNVVSATPSVRLGLQQAAACAVVALGVVAVAFCLGWSVYGRAAAGLPVEAVALMLAAVVAQALVALSIGFLLGQLGAGEMTANAVGNIVGMLLTFLGGAWMPLDLMPAAVREAAQFTPVYWYTDALDQCVRLYDVTPEAVASIAGSIGIVVLFAAALFAIALVAGRLRTQSATAGGNAAAALNAG